MAVSAGHDRVVLRTGVDDAIGALVAMAGDYDGLLDAPAILDLDGRAQAAQFRPVLGQASMERTGGGRNSAGSRTANAIERKTLLVPSLYPSLASLGPITKILNPNIFWTTHSPVESAASGADSVAR